MYSEGFICRYGFRGLERSACKWPSRVRVAGVAPLPRHTGTSNSSSVRLAQFVKMRMRLAKLVERPVDVRIHLIHVAIG